MLVPVRHRSHRLPGLPGGPSFTSIRRPSLLEGEGGGAGGTGDGGVDGGGGSGGEDPEALNRLQSWVAEQTRGLQANRDAILNEKQTLERQLADERKRWEGLDPDTVRAVLSKFQNDREIELIKDGKVDEVIQMRTEALRKDMQAKVDAASKKLDEMTETIARKDSRIKDLSINTAVHAALPEDIEKTAIPDVIREARDLFDLNEEDEIVARGPDGTQLFGKDGKSLLSIAEWMEGDRERNPHRYARSAGAGAQGGGSAGRKPNNNQNVDGMSARAKLTAAISGEAA